MPLGTVPFPLDLNTVPRILRTTASFGCSVGRLDVTAALSRHRRDLILRAAFVLTSLLTLMVTAAASGAA